MKHKKYGTLGELLEVMIKGYRHWRCYTREVHRWAKVPHGVLETHCLDCPETAWRYPEMPSWISSKPCETPKI